MKNFTNEFYKQKIEDAFQGINWNRLADFQFHKKDDYCFIYSYPPVRSLESIQEEDIFLPNPFQQNKDILNLYIHIPYCSAICSYCYFAKVVDSKNSPVLKDEYIDLLIWEISDKLSRFNSNCQITSIHFGGGTPSVLEERQIEKIMSYLNSLNLIENIEVTFECHPENLHDNTSKLEILQKYGVNRINIGIESMDDYVLKRMGRRHTQDMAMNAIKNVKKVGFENLNVDIIYGLPNETIDSWIDTLRICADIGIESISVYRLRKHPNKAISKLDENVFPSYEDGLKMQLAHSEVLLRQGYQRVQSHKYAITENKIQNQTEKKRGVSETQLLGAGCGAYGFMNGTFYWNTKSLERYGSQTRSRQHPLWMGKVLDKEDIIRKSFVLGVHTSKGINIADIEHTFGTDSYRFLEQEITMLIELGLLEQKATSLVPTELGYFFGDEISTVFYAPWVKNKLSEHGMRYGMFFEKDKYTN